MRARSPEGVCRVCVCGGCGMRKERERERRAARCRHVACGSRCRWDRHIYGIWERRVPAREREVECFENALHHIGATARGIVTPLHLCRCSRSYKWEWIASAASLYWFILYLLELVMSSLPSSYRSSLAHFVCVCSLVIMVTGPTLESLRHVGFAARNDVLCQNLPVWPRTSPQECRASYRSVGGLV